MGSPVEKTFFTYEDYRNLSHDEKWEIIDGRIYDMSPAPRITHQRIVGGLFHRLKIAVDRKCPVFMAPTDVVFDMHNVVQPDVFVVCDQAKITELNIQGAPDLVVEVISPSTSLKDRREKRNLYERFCVAEYLIACPESSTIERYTLRRKKYGLPDIFNWDEVVRLHAFEMDIELWEIFDRERPGSGPTYEKGAENE